MTDNKSEPGTKVERRNSFSMSRQLFNRIVREWIIVTLILIPLTAVLSLTNALGFDSLIYDRLLSLTRLGNDPRILIVKIDNRSLSEIGRWPWSREVHAALLDRLSDAKPAAILFDVVFTEPGLSPAVDRRFADALCKSGVVVLPSIRKQIALEGGATSEFLPVEPLRQCAWGIGHINVQADSDGVVRSVHLREGMVNKPRLQMAWVGYSLVDPAGAGQLPGQALAANAQGWVDDHVIRIPYLGRADTFASVSYSSLLRGEVPDSLLRNRIILIGATAPGLGDRYVTPISASAGVTPGIEIQANILNGLLQGRSVVELSGWRAMLLAVAPVMLLLAIMLISGLRYALLLSMSVVMLTLLACLMLLQAGWWWPPSASLLGVLLAYLLWNWRRLSAALGYFGWELARLDQEPQVLPERAFKKGHMTGDIIQQRIVALERAVDQVRNTRRFMTDGLEHLPVASLMCRRDGDILFANRRARALVKDHSVRRSLASYLQHLGHPDVSILDTNDPEQFKRLGEVEFRTSHGLSLRTEVASMMTAEHGTTAGWLISLVDLTSEREAEEQRASMLRFLSHDLRAPHSAILSLLSMHQAENDGHDQVFASIDKQVRRALRLTDDFLQLTKAESSEYRFEAVLFDSIVQDAVDEVWTLARNKMIRLKTCWPDEEAVVSADPGLLCRALFNLLENAIKYSPANTCVSVTLSIEQGMAVCVIADQGEGISAENIAQLFRNYQRFSLDTSVGGIGLGLAMVKAVVERHGGTIECQSVVGEGSVFSLKLPLLDESQA
ncbi:sensor domain CHASE2-containing protein [Pseudomonas segetis]|uniref:histidine kinase n=2 Tax=Pseudomonas segetis TaxID=298908 RepID=A0A239H5L8_9PSED|nr:sensor domain CHASE2-containing protein [Pseudomonas segetis]